MADVQDERRSGPTPVTAAIVDRLDAELRNIRSEAAGTSLHFEKLLEAHDKRYEQRFQASQDAVKAAFEAQENRINERLQAQDRAVNKAEIAAEKRFEGVNEFRAQLGDQQRTLMPRAEAENRLQMLMDKVNVLENFRTEQLTKSSGAKEGYGQAVAIVSLILALLSIISVGIILVSQLSAG